MNIQDKPVSDSDIVCTSSSASHPSTLLFDSLTSPWKLLAFLSVSILLISLSLNFLLLRQNQLLISQKQQQMKILQQVEQTEASFQALLQDVGHFSVQYPEVRAILIKYGIRVEGTP